MPLHHRVGTKTAVLLYVIDNQIFTGADDVLEQGLWHEAGAGQPRFFADDAFFVHLAFCLDVPLAAALYDEVAVLRPGIFDDDVHEFGHEFVQLDFARDSERGFGEREHIEFVAAVAAGAGGKSVAGGDCGNFQAVLLVELVYFGGCAPFLVEAAGFEQVLAALLGIGGGQKTGQKFVGEGFFVDIPVFVGGCYGVFVKLVGFGSFSRQPLHFGHHQILFGQVVGGRGFGKFLYQLERLSGASNQAVFFSGCFFGGTQQGEGVEIVRTHHVWGGHYRIKQFHGLFPIFQGIVGVVEKVGEHHARHVKDAQAAKVFSFDMLFYFNGFVVVRAKKTGADLVFVEQIGHSLPGYVEPADGGVLFDFLYGGTVGVYLFFEGQKWLAHVKLCGTVIENRIRAISEIAVFQSFLVSIEQAAQRMAEVRPPMQDKTRVDKVHPRIDGRGVQLFEYPNGDFAKFQPFVKFEGAAAHHQTVGGVSKCRLDVVAVLDGEADLFENDEGKKVGFCKIRRRSGVWQDFHNGRRFWLGHVGLPHQLVSRFSAQTQFCCYQTLDNVQFVRVAGEFHIQQVQHFHTGVQRLFIAGKGKIALYFDGVSFDFVEQFGGIAEDHASEPHHAVEVAAKVGCLRAFVVKFEREVIVSLPSIGGQQIGASGKVFPSRVVSGGIFGLFASGEVEHRKLRLFGLVFNELYAGVELIDHLEQPLSFFFF